MDPIVAELPAERKVRVLAFAEALLGEQESEYRSFVGENLAEKRIDPSSLELELEISTQPIGHVSTEVKLNHFSRPDVCNGLSPRIGTNRFSPADEGYLGLVEDVFARAVSMARCWLEHGVPGTQTTLFIPYPYASKFEERHRIPLVSMSYVGDTNRIGLRATEENLTRLLPLH